MSNFPAIRFKNMQGWIPDTDIDGVDAGEEFAASTRGWRFGNGFVITDWRMTAEAYPSNVQTDLTNGYALYSFIHFKHSGQGWQTLAVLWKAGAAAADKLRLYLNNTLMNIDERSSDISFSTAPAHINYNLVDDVLRINLNCPVTYNAISTGVSTKLNLALIYLDGTAYYNGLGFNPEDNRAAGWYLYPRWLGWNYTTILSPSAATNTLLDFEGSLSHGIVGEGFSSSNVAISTEAVYAGTYSAKFGSTTPSSNASITITNIDFAQKIYFRVYFPTSAGVLQWVIHDNDTGEDLASGAFQYDSVPAWEYKTINMPVLRDNLNLILQMPADSDFLYIDNLTIVYDFESEWAIVARYVGGQRGLLEYNDGTTNLNYGSTLRINFEEVDWRVESYELYLKQSDGIFYRVFDGLVDGTWDNSSGTYYEKDIVFDFESTDTLNFNYGLGADVRVDNEKDIYSEVAHKQRLYFVNEDYRVYQSHIAGNGLLQPDSFPYDADLNFGFFITSYEEVNKALAITSINDLAVITLTGLYVYIVQAGQGTAFKTLRYLTGSVGISSTASLTRNFDGRPPAEGLFWVGYNGIYYYPGGVTEPKNLIEGVMERFWETLTTAEKEAAAGFYNPLKHEYWVQVGATLLIYEIPYGKFRQGNTPSIISYAGIKDNVLYYIADTQYKLDYTTYNSGTLTTHYVAGDVRRAGGSGYFGEKGVEYYSKIAQEFYVSFGTCDSCNLNLKIYIDGHYVYQYTIAVASNLFYKVVAPESLRFRRLAMALDHVTADKLVIVKEFGCRYSESQNEATGMTI